MKRTRAGKVVKRKAVQRKPALYRQLKSGNRMGKTMTIWRTYSPSSVTITDSFQNLSLNFQLNSLPNVSELTSLFDCYRIKYVTVNWYNSRDAKATATGSLGTQSIVPVMHHVIDYDDDAVLSGLTSYQQYGTYKFERLTGEKVFSRTFKPKPSVGIFNNAATIVGGVVPESDTWIDLAQTQIPHYGWKYGISGDLETGTGLTILGRLLLSVTMCVELKFVR